MISDLFLMNCSTIFLLHPLGLNRKQLEGTGFCNCYLRDEGKPEYEGLNVVLLLFHVKDTASFRYFVEKERARTPLFIDEYDYDQDYVVLVYEFPEELSSDFEKFKQGAYSKFSKEFRKTVPETIEVRVQGRLIKNNSVQWMIINQMQEWKDVLRETYGDDINFDDGRELWGVMDLLDETITIPPKKVAP